jgi:hypothetical protein
MSRAWRPIQQVAACEAPQQLINESNKLLERMIP